MEHIIDVLPFVQILDVPVPQVGWRLDTLTTKQVIEVPKISQDSTPQRCGLATYADSWWKCRLSCLIPLCSSRLPSRTWTLQFLALVVIMGRGCTSPHPGARERDVTEILDHTTKRDDQPAKELSMVSTKTHTRLLARILRGLEAVEAGRLWEMADDELRKVRLGGGGPGNGSMWTSPMRSARDLLPDAHFMMSTVLRLGCERNATGRVCALLKFSDDPESQCAQPLDSRLHHTLTCKAGLARMRQHRAVAATLTNLLKQSGAQVDRERPAPHMSEFETIDEGERVVKEAILD